MGLRAGAASVLSELVVAGLIQYCFVLLVLLVAVFLWQA